MKLQYANTPLRGKYPQSASAGYGDLIRKPLTGGSVGTKKNNPIILDYSPDCNKANPYLRVNFTYEKKVDEKTIAFYLGVEKLRAIENGALEIDVKEIPRNLKLGNTYTLGEYAKNSQDITMTPLEVIVDANSGEEKLHVRLSAPKIGEKNK